MVSNLRPPIARLHDCPISKLTLTRLHFGAIRIAISGPLVSNREIAKWVGGGSRSARIELFEFVGANDRVDHLVARLSATKPLQVEIETLRVRWSREQHSAPHADEPGAIVLLGRDC